MRKLPVTKDGTTKSFKSNSAQQAYGARNSTCSNSQIGKHPESQDIAWRTQNNLALIIENSSRQHSLSPAKQILKLRSNNNIIASQKKKLKYSEIFEDTNK